MTQEPEPINIVIREAVITDAEAIGKVLTRSIREVCGPDYDFDEDLLARWCANKTPSNMERMLSNPKIYTVVAVSNAAIVGIAALTVSGEILLCYLLPECLQKGIGKKMLNNLLQVARLQGIRTVTLESTRTAHDFYRRNGFSDESEVFSMGMIPGYKMKMILTPDESSEI